MSESNLWISVNCENAARIQSMAVGAQHVKLAVARRKRNLSFAAPPAAEGELRWVREAGAILKDDRTDFFALRKKKFDDTWILGTEVRDNSRWTVLYKSDYPECRYPNTWTEDYVEDVPRWQPSTRMPVWTSRARVRIGKVQLVRLQQVWPSLYMSYYQPLATNLKEVIAKAKFHWDKSYRRTPYAYEADPNVWMIEMYLVQRYDGLARYDPEVMSF